MKYILGCCFVIVTFIGCAQPNEAIVKTIDGKKYYVHSVSEGNTLYGIHKLYDTDLNLIIDANPGLKDNLVIGQQILIPIDPSDTKHYTVHIVKEGETLYGISKQHGCTVSDLQKLNPDASQGIKIGQELKLPKPDSVGEVIQTDPIPQKEYEFEYSDSLVYHTVLEHETLYSIAKRYMVSTDTIRALNGIKKNKIKKGTVIKVPIKKVNYTVLEKEIIQPIHKDSTIETKAGIKKGTYKIALLLPFMFAKNDLEMSKTLKFGQVREMYPTTKIAFEFYQGFLFAADSLKKAGANLDIFVYDTKRDTATIGKILSSDELKDVDLVVGPLYKKTINYTVKECAKRNVRIVLPFKTDPAVLHENRLVFKAVSSNMTLMDGTVDYILREHANHNVILLKPYKEGDKALYERAKARFNEKVINQPSYNQKIIEMAWGSSSGRDINAQIKKDTTNVFIVPSSDINYVTGAMNRLNKVMNMNPYAKRLKIVVFGFEDWNKYDDVDVLHRNRLNQHYATYRFVDYNKGEGLKFVKAYRGQTGIDPTVYSSQGFDVGMYFLSALYLNGTNFENNLSTHAMNLVQNEFKFQSIAKGSGFENMSVSVVRYQDFELIECNH